MRGRATAAFHVKQRPSPAQSIVIQRIHGRDPHAHTMLIGTLANKSSTVLISLRRLHGILPIIIAHGDPGPIRVVSRETVRLIPEAELRQIVTTLLDPKAGLHTPWRNRYWRTLSVLCMRCAFVQGIRKARHSCSIATQRKFTPTMPSHHVSRQKISHVCTHHRHRTSRSHYSAFIPSPTVHHERWVARLTRSPVEGRSPCDRLEDYRQRSVHGARVSRETPWRR